MQAEDMKAERRVKLIEQGSQLFATACHESGIDVSKAQPTNDGELKHRAYSDRFDEQGASFNKWA